MLDLDHLRGNVADQILEAGPLTRDNAHVLGFRAREALSELFRVVVEITSPEEDLDFAGIVGAPARFTLHGREEDRSYFNGIVSRIGVTGHGENSVEYVVEIVPRVWLLTQCTHSRVFQGMTAPAIVAEVMTRAGIHKDSFTLPRTKYKKRDYCVQYEETDFAFVSRLLEEEGIFYYFEHTETGHHMAMADTASVHCPISRTPCVEFRDVFGGGRGDDEWIHRFHLTRRVRPGRVTLRDFDFQKPWLRVEETAFGEDDADLEMYTFAPGFVENPDANLPRGDRDYAGQAKQWARRRWEEVNASRIRGQGRSSVRRFRAGRTFTLSGHPRQALDGDYLLIAVEHQGSQRHALPGSTGPTSEPNYTNTFEVQPSLVPFRPPQVTPKPRMIGSRTAVVTGPPGEEIHTDRFGRVKIRFPWDQSETSGERTSCWVRVRQNWAGGAWGSLFIPRVGMEVVVDHLEGDPDRPIISGCVYNGANEVPYPLPQYKTRTTLKSNSSLGGKGYNELRFEDAAGGEEIYIHGQKDLNGEIENNQTYQIGANESHSVGANRTKSVGEDEKCTIGRDQTKQVGRNESATVGELRALQVGTNETKTVGADQQLTVGGNQTEAVGSDRKETVGGDASLSVGGSESHKVSSTQTVTVGVAQVVNVGGAQTLSVGGMQALNVGALQTITVGGAQLETIGLAKIVNAGEKIEFCCGSGKLVIESSGKITLEGTEIAINASGPVTVQGSVIELN